MKDQLLSIASLLSEQDIKYEVQSIPNNDTEEVGHFIHAPFLIGEPEADEPETVDVMIFSYEMWIIARAVVFSLEHFSASQRSKSVGKAVQLQHNFTMLRFCELQNTLLAEAQWPVTEKTLNPKQVNRALEETVNGTLYVRSELSD